MNIRHKFNSSSPYAAAALPRRSLLLVLVAAGWCHAALAGDGKAASAPFGVRSQDQIWLVSTRHIGCAADGQEPAVWQWNAGRWDASDAAAFHDGSSTDAQAVIYIHGNRIDNNEGASGGLAAYERIVVQFGDDTPVRFVIWSWPSTKVCGPIRDVLSKARRSDDEAILLAQFLAKNKLPKWRVGIVAFSYGARITGGAMHLLGGGKLDGYTVAAGEVPRFRVAFWAAAADDDWLVPEPGYRHHLAMPLGEKWLNLVNPRDESLVRYEALTLKGGNPPALGFVGLAGRDQLPPELAQRWEEWDVGSMVGRTHNYPPYVYSPWIAEQTAKCVLWK